MEKFHGVGPAMVTPYLENGELDIPSLKKLTYFLIEGGADYLVVQGTTGESPTVKPDEKKQILEAVSEENNGRLPIVFGVGGNSTEAVSNALKELETDHIDAILSVSPYYNKPSQRGIELHFKKVADASQVPIILYNVPSRTGSNIDANTTVALSKHPNIIGIKEASGSLEQAIQIRKEAQDDFLLISGEDLLTVPMISIGCVGVISVLANGFPHEFCQMIHFALEGKFDQAEKITRRFIGINPLMYQEGNPVGIKTVLEEKGICSAQVRLPLANASEGLRAKIKEEIKKAAF